MGIEVGKFTLESLTTGMYKDERAVYREYIQNSVDSLDKALSQELVSADSMKIEIIIDKVKRYIEIHDNGTGVSKTKAAEFLLSIGKSHKLHTKNRGFRGIGRLVGMSYCDTLVFLTSTKGENTSTEITFNCKRLRELLVPGKYNDYDLESVLLEITEITTNEVSNEEHFFIVKIISVSENSRLLDLDEMKSYVSQVAPLPYKNHKFTRSNDLHKYCKNNGYLIEEFPIFIGRSKSTLKEIYKPNRSRFSVNKGHDEIIGLRTFKVEFKGDLLALGWYAECEWLGTIKDEHISGFRVRDGNILIGDSKTLSSIFKEPRFNGWLQGELFVLAHDLLPNARRDDFEYNEAYSLLIDEMRNLIGDEVSSKIREASKSRNLDSQKIIKDAEQKIKTSRTILEEGFNSSVDKENTIVDLEKVLKKLNQIKKKDTLIDKKKKVEETVSKLKDDIETSNNYKIKKASSKLDRRSLKVLGLVSDILSNKLAKVLVDEIIDELVESLLKTEKV